MTQEEIKKVLEQAERDQNANTNIRNIHGFFGTEEKLKALDVWLALDFVDPELRGTLQPPPDAPLALIVYSAYGFTDVSIAVQITLDRIEFAHWDGLELTIRTVNKMHIVMRIA